MKLYNTLRIAYRKLALPIKRSDLVIDVGSGGNPHIWADVTTDMYEDNTQRFTEVKFKGLFVWSNAERLPFKHKVFDYSISSHVLEHSPYPERMIMELERISKAGYIETPPAWQELICPYKMHHSRVIQQGDTLVFKLKSQFDETLPLQFEDIEIFLKEFKKYADSNYTGFTVNKFFWKEKIKYRIIADDNYIPFNIELDIEEDTETRSLIHGSLKSIAERFLKRNKKINELDILCCPKCFSDLEIISEVMVCKDQSCANRYFKYKGYWDFRNF